jgi:hypothetical protein
MYGLKRFGWILLWGVASAAVLVLTDQWRYYLSIWWPCMGWISNDPLLAAVVTAALAGISKGLQGPPPVDLP